MPAYISFRGVTYKHVSGTATGSPVSVVVANLVMEEVEERALECFGMPLKFWKCYVDNVCTVVPESLIDSLLQHLNNVEPSIQ